MTAKRSRDAFLGVTKSHVQSFSAVVCMGRPLRAHVLIEILRILMGERSVARPELHALFDVPLRALFGYGVISGRVWASPKHAHETFLRLRASMGHSKSV